MVQYLFKTLIISILCGSLSTMNMSAFAQESAAASSGMTRATPTNAVSRDADGVYKKNDKLHFEKIEDSDMLASITMLAVGTIAGRVLAVYKPMTTDVMVAGAGGAAFMVGEIMSNMAFKKTMKDMTAEITKSSDGKKDQAQIQRLEDLKKSYQEAKKTTGTKKMLQMAAAAAFAGAAAIAAYKAYAEYTAFSNCLLAIGTAQKAVTLCPEAKDVPAPSAPAVLKNCGACAASLAGLNGKMANINAIRQSPGPSFVENQQAKKLQTEASVFMKSICKTGLTPIESSVPVSASCEAALAIESMNQIALYAMQPKALFSSHDFVKKILFGSQAPRFSYEILQSRDFSSSLVIERVLDLFLPKAEAGWLPLLGLGASAAATYFLIGGGLAASVDLQMFVPFNRAIAFGGLAALSFLAVKSSDNQIKKMDENIAKIDKILTEMNALENGIKTNTIQEQQIQMAGFNPNNQADLSMGLNPNVKTDCLTSNSTTNCPSLANELKNMPDFANLPESFKSIASQAAQMGDGLSGTNVISGSTLSTAANLANKAQAISKAQKNVQNKLNDLYGANGKEKIDFNKAEKDTINKWNEGTANALKSKGIAPGAFLSSVGLSSLPLSDYKTASLAPAAVKKSAYSNSGGVVNTAPINPKDKAFDLDFKESAGSNGALAGGAAGDGKDVKYDIGENDINTNINQSIFQMISDRYIKSGYPKLLEAEPIKNQSAQ